MLAVRLLAMAEELDPDQKHEATNRILDPRGDVLSEVKGELAVSAESARRDWLAGIMLASVVQLEATEEGTYTIELTVDEGSASLPLHIVHGSAPGVG